MSRSKLLKSCNFIEYSDLVDVAFNSDQSDKICEAMNNSEVSFGENNRTMVSLRWMCNLVRFDSDIEAVESAVICDKLEKLLKPDEYIDIEN